MNIQRILPLLTLAALAARAEVKEPGEVVARQCGQMTRTSQVCLAEVSGTGRLAVEISSFTPGPNDAPLDRKLLIGIVYDQETIAAVGATTQIYKALVPTQAEGSYKVIYKDVELRVVQVVHPDAKPTAELRINGELQYGRGFGWEDVVTTANLE